MTAKEQKRKDSKSVYFNLEDAMDKRIYDHVKGPYVRNFSSYVKGLILEDLQRTGGVVNPYEAANASMPDMNNNKVREEKAQDKEQESYVEKPRRRKVEDKQVEASKVEVEEEPFGFDEDEEEPVKDIRSSMVGGMVGMYKK